MWIRDWRGSTQRLENVYFVGKPDVSQLNHKQRDDLLAAVDPDFFKNNFLIYKEMSAPLVLSHSDPLVEPPRRFSKKILKRKVPPGTVVIAGR